MGTERRKVLALARRAGSTPRRRLDRRVEGAAPPTRRSRSMFDLATPRGRMMAIFPPARRTAKGRDSRGGRAGRRPHRSVRERSDVYHPVAEATSQDGRTPAISAASLWAMARSTSSKPFARTTKPFGVTTVVR